jgi:aspartate aminotransferase
MQTTAVRFSNVAPSASLSIAAEARRLRRQGKPILDLSLGELDFPTPANICEAAIRAIRNGATRYDSVAGLLELRQAICAKLHRENGLEYSADEISVGCGAKQIISSALLVSLEPGDEVLIPAPYWTSYPEMVRLAGGVPVTVDTSAVAHFKLTAADLRRAITSRTKWLILNSPNNPSGAVYSHEELRELAAEVLNHAQVGVISDEIYESMVYPPNAFASIAAARPELRNRVLVVNGVSKTYAMTGWRVGYGAGPPELVKAINDLQSQTTTHTSTISQHAAIEALNGSQEARVKFAETMRGRAQFITRLVNQTAGLDCLTPAGAFYCFANCSELMGRRSPKGDLLTDMDLSKYLLDDAMVATVPGTAYGKSPFIRLSFASDVNVIDEAFERIGAAIQRLN